MVVYTIKYHTNYNALSLRGAKRRGNLLVPFIDLLCSSKHCTGRFPRA